MTELQTGRRPTGGAAKVARSRRTITSSEWIDAAIAVLRRDGPEAIEIERLAATLGATKGGFYRRFRDRDALIAAALEHWEFLLSGPALSTLEAIDDPHERAKAGGAFAAHPDDPVSLGMLLLAYGRNPRVAPITARVLNRWMTYSIRTRRQIGMQDEQARLHAMLTYATFTGMALLRHGAPHLLPEIQDQLRAFAERLLNSALPLPVEAPDTGVA